MVVPVACIWYLRPDCCIKRWISAICCAKETFWAPI